MFKQTISIVAVAGLVLALAPAAQAGLVGQLGLLDEAWFAANPTNPDTGLAWQAGDPYHLLFATDATTVASINPPVAPYDSIAFWDAKVQTEGNTAAGGAGAGVTWRVVASIATSTGTVHAKDHAAVSGPVYTMQGVPLASNNADLWDGSVANEITRMDGSSVDTGYARLVWTGSDSDGTAVAGRELGTTTRYAYCGDPKANSGPVGAQWLKYANPKQDFWRDMSLYGVSEALTVASTAPPAGIEVVATAGTWLVTREENPQPEILVVDKTAVDMDPFDMEITVTGGLTAITIDETVLNDTMEDWTDYHVQLGTGLGIDFVASTLGDGLSLISGTSATFPTVTPLGEDELAFSGSIVGRLNSDILQLQLQVPGTDPYTFTLRQWPTRPTTVIPEPSTLLIWALGLLGLIGFARRRKR